MFNKLYKEWNTNSSERQKLQWVLALVAVSVLVAAGIISLGNQELGISLLNVAYVAALVWLVNFVVWAIFIATIGVQPEAPVAKPRQTRRK